jgi:hypothetical protein
MLMKDYALNKDEKRNLVLESPDCPGQIRNVRETPNLLENSRTLRAFRTPVKNSIHQRFSISHKSSLESKNRIKHHKHTIKCLKLT